MSPDTTDRLGYYKTLGIPPEASAEQVRIAYRQLVKRYHPDINASKEAAKHFRQVVQAYEILGNLKSRQEYDTPTNTQESLEELQDVLPLLTCEGCGIASPHLKIIAINWVWSVLFFTRRGVTPRMLCPQCGNRHLCAAGTKSAIFGWWGFPFGLVYTPIALFNNLTPGRDFLEDNVHLSVHQAMAFHQRGETDNAEISKHQASKIAEGKYHLENHVQILNGFIKDQSIETSLIGWGMIEGNGILRIIPILISTMLVGGVAAQINADTQRQAAATARCMTLQTEMRREKDRLTALESRLNQEDSDLSQRKAQLESKRGYIDPNIFNIEVANYNLALTKFNYSVTAYKGAIEPYNLQVSIYNRKCVE